MGETSNSYVGLTDSDTYFSNLPLVDTNPKSQYWDSLEDNEKTQLLISACYDIEQLKFVEHGAFDISDINLTYDSMSHRNYYSYPSSLSGRSVKYNPFQQLQFPRNRDVRADGTVYIPERVLMAQCEQAYYLGTLDESTITSIRQGIAEETFIGGGIETVVKYAAAGATNASTLAPLTLQWLRPFILKSVRRFERG